MATSNYLSLKGEKIIAAFRFDPRLVETVRKIDGRFWNTKDKQWEFPAENVVEVLKALEPYGFYVHPDLIKLKNVEEAFVNKLEELKNAPDIPYEGSLPLLDFQRKGVSFMKMMPAALLADVPGLGKTIQTIAAVEQDPTVLVFVPASLKYSWEGEIKKWQPDAKIVVIDGNKEERLSQWITGMNGFFQGGVKVIPKYVIANYELLIHDFDVIKNHEWGTIVCDEATRISNPDATSVKNLKQLRSKKRYALTGTPISNKPDDIFSIIDWLVPRYLGTYAQFKKKYCEMEEDWGQGRTFSRIVGYKDIDVLKAKVERLMLRRTKEEVFKDFPPKTVENIVFQLSADERKLYNSIKTLLFAEIKELSHLDTWTLSNILVKMLRLKQCTNHPSLVDGKSTMYKTSSKLEVLRELLKPIIESGEKAIIFTQFSEMLTILAVELRDYRPLTIYGHVKPLDRAIKVKEFNDDPKPRIIIMTEAGAYGLNMQSATYVIHYDAPWSIAKLMQREDRAHRHGQTKPVTVYNLIAKDTIDEYVMKVLHNKQKVSVNILQDAERLADGGMSEEDIRTILRL